MQEVEAGASWEPQEEVGESFGRSPPAWDCKLVVWHVADAALGSGIVVMPKEWVE